MEERPRHREVLGATSSVCPNCGGGPMVVTRSRHVRRLRDLLNPRFDPDVVHREACTACDARFPAGGERLRLLLAEAAAGPPAASAPARRTAAAPPPSAEPDAAPAPGPTATAHDAEVAVVDAEQAARAPEPAVGAEPRVQPVAPRRAAVVVPGAARSTGTRAPTRRTPVGAGRRSGPVRRVGGLPG